ncbi:MAG: penicillin-binding protein activator [Candidatus Pacebacteria bacterium]|nr:penicillin-binding protein activator [Candidatus Paceibacterota bacterium]
MNKAIGWIVIIVLVVWGLSSLSGKSSKVDEVQKTVDTLSTYKVGAIAPLTGDAATYGELVRNTLQIAADEINSSGGISGKRVEVIIEDGKCNGEGAVNAAQKLVNVDKVQVIIGGFCSAETLAALPVAETAKVALISAASSNPSLTGKSSYFFRNFPSDSSQGSVLAQMAHDMGKRKVAFIQEQTDYTAGIYKAFADKFTSLGGQVIKEEYAPATKDFRTQLSKLQSQKADALFIDSNIPASADAITAQMIALKWNVSLFTNDITLGATDVLSKYKDALNGMVGAEFSTDSSNKTFAHLLEVYKTKYGKDMPYQSYGQTVYDAIYIVKDAITKVGYDGTKIADFGHRIANWNGASGSVTIGANGDLVGGHKARVFKDGKVQDLK